MIVDTPRGSQAVVLSGGGGYGAYEVGVMRALFNGASAFTGYRAIEPAIVTGTSAGAFNAALLCSAPPDTDALTALDYVEDVWLHRIAGDECGNNVLRFRGNPLSLFDVQCATTGRAVRELTEDSAYLAFEASARTAVLASGEGSFQQRVLDTFDASVFVSADRFVHLVAETINLAHIRESTRALRIAATNWRTGELRVFENQHMTDRWGLSIVLASTAIPGVFQTVDIEGEPYADGGLVMNTPLSPAIDAGAETVHVIYMDPAAARVPLPAVRSTASTLYRMAVIALASMMNRDIEIARRINKGVDVAAGRASADDSVEHLKSVPLMVSHRPQANWTPPYRKVVIHRYHPHEDPGGTLRWLSFDRDRIVRMMDQGYEDAIDHDCEHRECLLATVSQP